MRIDLHSHSTASDGTDTPADLVRAAATAGLDVVALTDHDTTAGWDEAVAALPSRMTLVRGMEMSCTGRGEDGHPVAVHLLAYLFDPADPVFAAERERLRTERVGRIRAMAYRMAEDGLLPDPESVVEAAGPVAGRPHLARALVEAGVVPTVGAAFTDLLSPRGRYYVPKDDTALEDAVRMVTAAGGVTVLAHARARARGRLLALDHVEELVDHGLGGLEAEHPDHDAADVRLMRDMAANLGLFVTGSSDYHGANKDIGIGRFTTHPAALEELIARTSGVEVVVG
ncbi:PHP domain-containing protein [Rhodococcus sp. NPDC003382]|uniref:PHP domain-containing protein n=1 Tax=unclassified Rhodococcus (in: high G+C Gram-positive bacteria) TaxID=192944 RepID=UPI0018CC93E9|nr:MULTISPECIES: PHP domain-containing protein [unclassified Rhodococcus (in: high G+C Gram-positive bacteria)]MBH0123455.1 PHP domain-containing protein [Rhodococcus sp. CX]MCK8671870.1 PHP domain-containing protein [Rhodococcus sp. HM1]